MFFETASRENLKSFKQGLSLETSVTASSSIIKNVGCARTSARFKYILATIGCMRREFIMDSTLPYLAIKIK